MFTLEIEAAHGAFEIVQRNVFKPTGSPVTVVLFKSGFVIVPPPAINDH